VVISEMTSSRRERSWLAKGIKNSPVQPLIDKNDSRWPGGALLESNFDFGVNLPEAKSGLLLSFLTHTDFEDRSTFRDQIACLPNGLTPHPENIASDHNLAQIFLCSADSSIFKSAD
jgi:hypothetical protein